MLKKVFGEQFFSQNGSVCWLPRSCDLTSLDCFLWGYLKSLVYVYKPNTIEGLQDSITLDSVIEGVKRSRRCNCCCFVQTTLRRIYAVTIFLNFYSNKIISYVSSQYTLQPHNISTYRQLQTYIGNNEEQIILLTHIFVQLSFIFLQAIMTS